MLRLGTTPEALCSRLKVVHRSQVVWVPFEQAGLQAAVWSTAAAHRHVAESMEVLGHEL